MATGTVRARSRRAPCAGRSPLRKRFGCRRSGGTSRSWKPFSRCSPAPPRGPRRGSLLRLELPLDRVLITDRAIDPVLCAMRTGAALALLGGPQGAAVEAALDGEQDFDVVAERGHVSGSGLGGSV